MRQMFVGIFALVMACADGSWPPEPAEFADTTGTEVVRVGKVYVSPVNKVIAVGQAFRLTVTVRDPEGRIIDDPKLVFSAADSQVAIVDQHGVVTAQAVGETSIIVWSGGKRAATSITVTAQDEEGDPCYGCWDY